jgi:hypothetical protein
VATFFLSYYIELLFFSLSNAVPTFQAHSGVNKLDYLKKRMDLSPSLAPLYITYHNVTVLLLLWTTRGTRTQLGRLHDMWPVRGLLQTHRTEHCQRIQTPKHQVREQFSTRE